MILLLALGTLCLAGCPLPEDLPPMRTDYWREIEPTTGGSFFIYVPSTYNESAPMPVIITPTALAPAYLATELNNTSTAGRWW